MQLWEVFDFIDDRMLRHRFHGFCELASRTYPSDDQFTLYGDDARRFIYRMEHPEEFPLTPEQKALYAGAGEAYRKLMPQELDPPRRL